jgi:hypothetical protein
MRTSNFTWPLLFAPLKYNLFINVLFPSPRTALCQPYLHDHISVSRRQECHKYHCMALYPY